MCAWIGAPNNIAWALEEQYIIVLLSVVRLAIWESGMKLRIWAHDNHSITSFMAHTHKNEIRFETLFWADVRESVGMRLYSSVHAV